MKKGNVCLYVENLRQPTCTDSCVKMEKNEHKYSVADSAVVIMEHPPPPPIQSELGFGHWYSACIWHYTREAKLTFVCGVISLNIPLHETCSGFGVVHCLTVDRRGSTRLRSFACKNDTSLVDECIPVRRCKMYKLLYIIILTELVNFTQHYAFQQSDRNHTNILKKEKTKLSSLPRETLYVSTIQPSSANRYNDNLDETRSNLDQRSSAVNEVARNTKHGENFGMHHVTSPMPVFSDVMLSDDSSTCAYRKWK